MLAAHEVRVRLPGLVDVVGVGAGAAQELGIFRALDALADAVIRGQGNNSGWFKGVEPEANFSDRERNAIVSARRCDVATRDRTRHREIAKQPHGALAKAGLLRSVILECRGEIAPDLAAKNNAQRH